MSQEKEPKTLRDVLIDYMLIATIIAETDIETPLERDLLAWAHAYGEQVREYLAHEFERDGLIRGSLSVRQACAREIRDLKLPEPT